MSRAQRQGSPTTQSTLPHLGRRAATTPPDNRVLDTGIEVTGSILPWPYRPGPNNAGEGGKRCPRQMRQLCPARWGAATCAWPCQSPVSSLAQGACQGSATCPAPLWSPTGHQPLRLPRGKGTWGSLLAPRSPALAPSPCVTCPDHHRVVLPLQLVCCPGMGQPCCRQPQGQMPAPQTVGRAARAQSCPEPSCPHPAVPGHGCPAPGSLDFAFVAELFPELPGRGGPRQGTPWRRAGHCVPGHAGTHQALPCWCCPHQGGHPGRVLLGACSGAGDQPVLRRRQGQILPGAQQTARCSPACTPGRCWAGRQGLRVPPAPVLLQGGPRGTWLG